MRAAGPRVRCKVTIDGRVVDPMTIRPLDGRSLPGPFLTAVLRRTDEADRLRHPSGAPATVSGL